MQNLKMLREERSMSQQALADHIGVDRTSIGKYEKHGVLPSKEVLFKMADFFGVSIDFILGYNSKPNSNYMLVSTAQKQLLNLYKNANQQAQETALIILYRGQDPKKQKPMNSHENVSISDLPAIPSYVTIPVVGRAAAGIPIEMISDDNGSLSLSDHKIQYGDFAVIAVGDSMIDAGICDGDRVVIRPQPIVENGEIALIAIDNDSTIKRFYTDRSGYRLVPANRHYSIQQYPPEYTVKVLGKVIKVIREGNDEEESER
jgi:repressor LexA